MPFDHFNIIAGFYDQVGSFRPSEMLLGSLALSPNNILLDVGGGTGRVSAVLADKVREVIVADVSRGMLRRSATKGLATVCAPAECLPFPCGSFDRVIMVDALHHVMDQQETACELWRILAPGGRIVIVEPDIRRFVVKLIAIGEKILQMRSHFLGGGKISFLFNVMEAKTEILYDEFNVVFIAEKVRRM